MTAVALAIGLILHAPPSVPAGWSITVTLSITAEMGEALTPAQLALQTRIGLSTPVRNLPDWSSACNGSDCIEDASARLTQPSTPGSAFAGYALGEAPVQWFTLHIPLTAAPGDVIFVEPSAEGLTGQPIGVEITSAPMTLEDVQKALADWIASTAPVEFFWLVALLETMR